jgi:hypothetical protein
MCYFYTNDNDKCLLPIISNRYEISIKDKFAEIKSIQTYRNPFTKPLEIHYAVPTDASFTLTRLTAQYQGLIVEGIVKERNKVKAEYKEAK